MPAFAAGGTTPTPTPSPTLSGTVQASLSPTGDGVFEPGRQLSAYASLQNGTAHALAGAPVTMTVSPVTLADRAAVTRWLDGEYSIRGMKQVAKGSLSPVDSGALASVMLTSSVHNATLDALRPGVHAVAVTIDGAAQTYTATSVITVPAATHTTGTPVGLVVPITAGPVRTGLLTVKQLTNLTAPDGGLTADLDAVAGTPAILAIDPAIPASIRVLGTSAPASAQAWLDRLDALSNERFALQFGDADVAVQTGLGRTALLQPTSLVGYERPADFTPKPDAEAPGQASTPTPSPTPSVTPGVPDYPTMAQLLNIGPDTRKAVTWPFSGTATAKDVTALGAMSSGATTAVTLIPSDTTAAGRTGAVVTAHGTAGRSDVLVYDSTVSAQLRAASTVDAAQLRGAPLAAATAYLTLAAGASHGAPLLVAVDRAAVRADLGLADAVEAVLRAPGTEPASLSSLLAAPTAPVTVTATTVRAAGTAALDSLQDQETEVARFATVLTQPDLLTGPQRAVTLQLMGGGWLDDDTAWQAALAAQQKATAATLDAVSISPSSAINLAGTSAPLRFGVRNDLPWPVTVDLIAMPNDLRLEVQRTTTVTAQASSTTRVAVPVRARIGNGEVSLSLHLVSSSGQRIGDTQDVSLTVRAEWGTIGLTVLGAGIGLFVVFGVIRTVRRQRPISGMRARRPADREDAS